MIGKVVKSGKSFKGCVEYCILKEQAQVLHADGVRTGCTHQATADFNMQRKMNTNLGKAVGHISLSFSPDDAGKLTDEKMVEIALQYLDRMKIRDTQMLIVKHQDTEHPHVHIIYNRVDNQGKTISDSMLRERNVNVCKALTKEHSLTFGQGKDIVNRQKLRAAELAKYQIYDAIKAISPKMRSMNELQNHLRKHGIDVQYKFRSGTHEIQGISFSIGEYKFKGSEIERGFSYGKLMGICESNSLYAIQREQKQSQKQWFNPAHHEHTVALSIGRSGPSLFETLLANNVAAAQPTMDDSLFRKRKKKKGQGQSQGMSR